MPKPNAMLARIEAAAKARYQARLHTSMDMLLQLGQDAAAIATHVVFQLGPGGAEQFFVAYREAINDMARRVVDSEQKNEFGKTVWPKFEVTNEVTEIFDFQNFSRQFAHFCSSYEKASKCYEEIEMWNSGFLRDRIDYQTVSCCVVISFPQGQVIKSRVFEPKYWPLCVKKQTHFRAGCPPVGSAFAR